MKIIKRYKDNNHLTVGYTVSNDGVEVYSGHKTCNTVEEVKHFRTKCLHKLISDYIGFDWQYHSLIKFLWGIKAKPFSFACESCFADGDWTKQSSEEDYKRDFVDAHLLGYRGRQMGNKHGI